MWFLGGEARAGLEGNYLRGFLGRNSPCYRRMCKSTPLLWPVWVQFLHLRVGTRVKGLDVFSFLSAIGLSSSSLLPDSPRPGMVPCTVGSLQVSRKGQVAPPETGTPAHTLLREWPWGMSCQNLGC